MALLPFSDASPPTTNASLLTSGTLADARLSANVVTLNGTQTLNNKSFSSISVIGNGAASAPPASLTGTWFSGGTATTTKPQLLIEPTGTTSTSWSTAGTGLGVNAPSGFTGNLLDLQVNGAIAFTVSNTGLLGGVSQVNLTPVPGQNGIQIALGGGASGLFLASELELAWSSAIGSQSIFSAPRDLRLFRDAANTLAQRNGTNAQAFRLYNTYTDASNYERGFMRWSSNVLQVGTEKLGTGSARELQFVVDGVPRVQIPASGGRISLVASETFAPTQFTGIWRFSNDICVSSQHRFRFYADLVTPQIIFDVDNTTNTAFIKSTLFQIGGTTSAFPALKRSSTTLQVRLADDSAFASVQGKITTETAYTATTIVPTGYVTIYDSTGTAYKVACSL